MYVLMQIWVWVREHLRVIFGVGGMGLVGVIFGFCGRGAWIIGLRFRLV